MIDIEAKKKQAVALKASGQCNCAQAVACTFADEAGVPANALMRVAASFGTGMGCLEGTCGALVGAGIVLGLCRPGRVEAMGDMRLVMGAFKARNGDTVCGRLKGVGTGRPLRLCNDCVADAVEFLAGVLDR